MNIHEIQHAINKLNYADMSLLDLRFEFMGTRMLMFIESEDAAMVNVLTFHKVDDINIGTLSGEGIYDYDPIEEWTFEYIKTNVHELKISELKKSKRKKIEFDLHPIFGSISFEKLEIAEKKRSDYHFFWQDNE